VVRRHGSTAYNDEVLGAESQASIGATGPRLRLNWRWPLMCRKRLIVCGAALVSEERTALTAAFDPLQPVARERADIRGVHRNDRSREKTTFPPANHLAPAPNIPRSITIPMA